MSDAENGYPYNLLKSRQGPDPKPIRLGVWGDTEKAKIVFLAASVIDSEIMWA